MTLPTKIKIGPITYEVHEREGLATKDRERILDGEIRHGDCVILIEKSLAPQAQRQTIWHEVVHAILTQAGVRKQDENQVDVIAYGIMGVLQDNPWLAGPTEDK